MGADLVLWQADGVAHGFEAVEFQGVHTYALSYHLDHIGVLLRGFVAVGLDVAYLAVLKFLDATAGDKLHVVFRGGEVQILATVDQWRAADADVDFFYAAVVEHLHVVA